MLVNSGEKKKTKKVFKSATFLLKFSVSRTFSHQEKFT